MHKKRMKSSTFFLLCLCLFALAGCTGKMASLVPDTASNAPDYFCTWNTQGYVVSYTGPDMMRSAMTEENMLGTGQYQNWVQFFPKIRKDLYFVMDDSWDIPRNENSANRNPYLGLCELDEGRFPSYQGTPAERLRLLTKRIKQEGWKGLGGWICAQKAGGYEHQSEEEYWTERLKAAANAGFSYWKVDWGHLDRNEDWRRMLTRMGKKYAPNLWIEHAMHGHFIRFSDAFRTYDVENIIAQPLTIRRVAELLPYKTEGNNKGIINCEDEPYIAVGLGCAIGIMRHPMDGNLPDGRQDEVFPPVGHNYKKCMDEVVRAVRWHRIAEPFGVDGNFEADTVMLTDHWVLNENETWNKGRRIGTTLRESAPARVSRNMSLPIVDDHTNERPYILSSTYPSGAIAISAIGRTIGRQYICKEVAVTANAKDWHAPIGLFGYFKEVCLLYPKNINKSGKHSPKVLAQDLAGDTPVDITSEVSIESNKLTIPGEVIRRVGLMASSANDLSAPGLVIRIM